MKTVCREAKNKITLTKIARSVSFSSKSLSEKKAVSKDRERYVKNISAEALSAISA